MKTLTTLFYMHTSKFGWLLLCLLLYCTGKELRAQPTHPPLDSATLATKKIYTYKDLQEALKNPLEVYKLYLSYGMDRGGYTELPQEIFQFRNLQELHCHENLLTFLPNEIGKLTNLTYFNCAGNQISSLPAEIGNLVNLEILILGNDFIISEFTTDNKLTTLPKEIGKLIKLKELHCAENKLTTLPAEIGKLVNLTYFDCTYNKLTALPTEIGKLQNLITFNCYDNKLTALPAEIGKLQNLTTFNCYDNKLTALPAEIGKLQNLTTFNCENNKLTALPAEIGKLTNLTDFSCGDNQLTILPESIGELKKLEKLDIEHNQLTALPETMGKLKNLRELIVWGNQITSMPMQLLEKEDLLVRTMFINLDVPYIPDFRIGYYFDIGNMLESDMNVGRNKKHGESLYLCYRKYYAKESKEGVSFDVIRVLTFGAWWYSRNGQFAKAQATAQELLEMLKKYKEDNKDKLDNKKKLEKIDEWKWERIKDKLRYIEIQAQAILQYTAQGINLLSAKEQAEIATQTAEERKKLAESLRQEAEDAKENALKDRKDAQTNAQKAEANAQKAQKLTAEAHEAKELAKAEAQRSRWLTVWVTLISMGILFVVLLFLVYFVYTKRKISHKAKELEKRNQEIHALAEELRQQSDALIEQRNELEAITEELKQQNEVVESKNVALEQLQDTKDLMISAVNHDLRNPLNPIINFSRADYPDMTEAERLASIHAHAGMMLKLIDNIMQVYRADKITVQPAPHALHRATEEAIAVMLVAQNRKPKIINDIPQDLQASFDYAYIERVLENLLSNAIKYTASEEKGGIVRFFAEIVASPTPTRGELVKISIQDNGKGIPQDQYESIFLPFVNPDAKSIGSAKSVGIGLTFCKTIMEAHNSHIELASEVGKGTTFSFALPYLKPETKTNETIAQNLTATPLLEAEREAVAEHIAEIKRLGWRDGGLTAYIEAMQVPDSPALQAWKNNLLEARKQRKKDIFEQLLN